MQTEIKKASERMSSMEFRFEHPRPELTRHHRLMTEPNLCSGLFGWGIVILLRKWGSLATEPQTRVLIQVISQPSHTATRSSHETNTSQTPQKTHPIKQDSNNSASTSSLYDPDSTKSSSGPRRELSTFLEKQFRRKLTYGQVGEILVSKMTYSVPLVDWLLDPSLVNQINSTRTKKYM